jgi:hypothetical protein
MLKHWFPQSLLQALPLGFQVNSSAQIRYVQEIHLFEKCEANNSMLMFRLVSVT